jgi:hypothetical protein
MARAWGPYPHAVVDVISRGGARVSSMGVASGGGVAAWCRALCPSCSIGHESQWARSDPMAAIVQYISGVASRSGALLFLPQYLAMTMMVHHAIVTSHRTRGGQ